MIWTKKYQNYFYKKPSEKSSNKLLLDVFSRIKGINKRNDQVCIIIDYTSPIKRRVHFHLSYKNHTYDAYFSPIAFTCIFGSLFGLSIMILFTTLGTMKQLLYSRCSQ